MRKIYSLLFAVALFGISKITAQVITVTNPANTTPALAATYGSLGAAMNAVNSTTAISGPVTITLSAAQTAPSGGYVIQNSGITGGSNTNRITFNGGGNTITAGVGISTTNDAIIKIIGTDFITIQNFVMNEAATNLTATTRVEWGIAVLYGTTTNGSQNIILQNNTISLNRANVNTFGIYSNSTHTATAPTSALAATTTAGANSGLKVYSNTISNVNMGIVVIGSTAAADVNTGVEIGGTSLGNTITNFGTSSAISSYANVSNIVNGILIRNSNGFVISNNTITSSVSGVVGGDLVGIQQAASSNTPAGTFTNVFNSNTISLQSVVPSGTINGIYIPSGSASTTSILNINSNNFNTFGHTVAASGSIAFIVDASTHLTTTINSNTFTNISVNTTGSVTFISHNYSIPAAGSCSINNNNIVTAFSKTGAGGSVTLTSTAGASGNTAVFNQTGNNFSNITVTGATLLTGFDNTDGLGTSPVKTVTGNTFNNWTGGTSAILCMNYTCIGGAVTAFSTNTLTNITGQAAITGISVGSAISGAGIVNVASNTITNLTSTGTGGGILGITCTNTSTTINVNNNIISTFATTSSGAVTGISTTGATTNNIFKNSICDLSGSNSGSTVNGIFVSAGGAIISNNRIGDLRTPVANAPNPLNGININGGSGANVYYNTVNLSASSSGAVFGSSAILASITPTVTLRNNIFINTSPHRGSGLSVAYRRSNASLFTHGIASDRNDFFAEIIFTDGATSQSSLAGYKAMVAPTRDANSISVAPPFLSTTCGNADFLKINTAIATQLESKGTNISGFTNDFENDIRQGNAGYTGTGTAPDLGADEFNGTPAIACTGTPSSSAINAVENAVCRSAGTTLSLSTVYNDIGITYQWKYSLTPGGPYSNIGTGAFQVTGGLPMSFYYVAAITCTNSGLIFTTAEKAITVNPLPTVTVSPASGTYCSPGGTPVTLTASGASTYTWANTTGLSAGTGAIVTATPSTNQTYSPVGTDANGCVSTNTASAVVTVAAKPQNVTATATPANICSGTTSFLSGTGTISFTANQYLFSTSTGAELDPMNGAITIIGSPAVSLGTGDNTPSSLQTLGFTFYYEGTAYTQYSISPDGWILLGSGTATAQPGNFVTSTSNVPKIYPLWDDLSTGTNGSVKVLVSGSAPNRIFIAQWNVTSPGVVSASANTAYQAWLYEGSNKIEFRYALAGVSASASAGLTGLTSTNFQSITFSSNTSTSSFGAANNNLTTPPAPGTIYSFTPVLPTFTWTASTNLLNPSAQNTATTALAASETFTLTASNAGCTTTAAALITADPLTAANITTTGSLCPNTNFTATANTTGGFPAYHYSWSDGEAGVYPDAQTITINKPAGSYTLSVTVTDACGEIVPMTLPVTVNALPVIIITPTPGTARICGTGSVSMLASGGASYVWSPATFLAPSNGLSATEVSSATVTTAYTVTGTDANGCVNTASQTVTYGPAITMDAVNASPAAICSGGTSVLSASATASLPLNYTYTVEPIPVVAEGISGNAVGLAYGLSYHPSPSGVSGNDGYWDGIALPFSFNYFGVTYSTVRIGTNGTVQFGPLVNGGRNPGSSSNTAQTIPTGGPIGAVNYLDNFIAGPWIDMDLSSAGLFYFSNGVAPNRKFVIYYDLASVPPNFSTSSSQIILNENGTIDILLLRNGLLSNALKAVGIENAGGTAGVAPPGRNAGNWTTSANEGWRFSPSSLDYSWEPSTGLTPSALIASPTTPALTSTTPYTVTATDRISGCFAAGNAIVTVKTPVGLSSASAVEPICSDAATTALTYSGLTGTNASVSWWTGPGATGTPVGTGLTSNPVGAGTYYAYATGDCGSPAEASVTVTVSSNIFTGTGNWTDNARWSCGAPPSTGDVIFIAAGANATLNTNFTVAGTLTMAATSILTINPTRTLSVSGTANFAGQSVTFKSDAIGTASLGQVTGSLTGATNVTVERYIPNSSGYRAWRLLSVPTFGSQTIKAAWQEGNAPLGNSKPNFGVQITGPAGTGAGFDATTSSASLLTWNNGAWANAASTLGAISANPYKAYFLFVRGERTKGVQGTNANTSATTLETRGNIYTGNQIISIPDGENKFSLIPNLYPSAIKFTGLTKTNVDNTYYIWDSKITAGGTLTGKYHTFTGATFFASSAGGSYGTGITMDTIQSGQAFLVHTSATAGEHSITLHENDKISVANGNLGLRPVNPASLVKIDTRLYTVSGSNRDIADGNTVVFDNVYSNEVDRDDAAKLGNPGENFAVLKNTKGLAVEARPLITAEDVISFKMWNMRQQTYQLEIVPANLETGGLTAELEDAYLCTSAPVSLYTATVINFTVDANAGSSAPGRFRIVFKKAAPVVVVDVKPGFAISPNPSEGSNINLRFINQAAGRYTIRLLGTSGQAIFTSIVSHAGGNTIQVLNLPASITKGAYHVEIIAPDKNKEVKTLFISGK